jgi:hypothetical protein
MISSPCKNCPRENLPKENCIKTCNILQAIQNMEPFTQKSNDGCGIDYTEEYNYIAAFSSE